MLELNNELAAYLSIGALLFCLGLFGIIHRRSLIGMLIAAELIMAGASVNFMAFNRFLAPEPTTGQIFTLVIMGIAAAEGAIAMSIILAVYRNYKSIDVDDITELKG